MTKFRRVSVIVLAALLWVSSLTGAARYARTGLVNPDLSPEPCYTLKHKPKECRPDFENAALNRRVVASSTCGVQPEKYCKSTTNNQGQITR
ncbi:netrin-1 [Plakobranchus ocellatus]|uniref:Netrin-1 n=1 Tax=Plakobranchus ocellatus TaxID=259542 RepID=A0AAV4CN25_9GAST|nr:netrin-1 [Plakobranchus ocellatus]